MVAALTCRDSLFNKVSRASLDKSAGRFTAGASAFPSSSLINWTTILDASGSGSFTGSGTPWYSFLRFGGGRRVAICRRRVQVSSATSGIDAPRGDPNIREVISSKFRQLYAVQPQVKATRKGAAVWDNTTQDIDTEHAPKLYQMEGHSGGSWICAKVRGVKSMFKCATSCK
jgi:hypothetical protein